MGRGLRRQAPALTVACVALVAALGGTVYAEKKAKKMDGKAIRVKSLPGNRLALKSVPGNRLKPGTVPADRLAPGTISGAHVEVSTLGQVPSAVHADSADSARDAQTALHAVNAIDAQKVNGRSAGCRGETRFFAGGCWQEEPSPAPVTAPAAAVACANQGGELPDALTLAALAQQPGIALAADGEWTGDIPVVSGLNIYAVATVSPAGAISSDLAAGPKKYRCVIPLVS
ncbi:MAG TPA: hypothetical protein VFY48_04890 [Solirubrobacterales bacterium]|nr:hypothetical protein [Solirubrobacterales bacterium]